MDTADPLQQMSSTTSTDASPTLPPSRPRTFFRFWKKPRVPESNTNLNCGYIPPTTIKLPVQPPATLAAQDVRITCDDLAADFFGAGEAHRTAPVPSPQPYAPYGLDIIETQAGVYTVQEAPTLARMLFFYGFLFFPFWLVGFSVLFFPLLPTEDWESGKSEVEKVNLLRAHRETEKKWARRCIIAMSSLIVVVLLLAIIIKYGIMASV